MFSGILGFNFFNSSNKPNATKSVNAKDEKIFQDGDDLTRSVTFQDGDDLTLKKTDVPTSRFNRFT